MDTLGLSATDRAQWMSTLLTDCSAWSTVDVLDLDGNYQTELDPVDGQVDVDSTTAVTRSCQVTLLDPGSWLEGLHALRYMLRIRYVVDDPVLGLVRCPLFTGPVSAPPSRSGQEVTVTGQDPSMVLALGRYPKTYPKNTIAHTVKAILKDCGFAGPFLGDGFQSSKRHHDKITVGWDDPLIPLTRIHQLAGDGGFHFYFNGAGLPVLRTPPSRPDSIQPTLDGLATTDPTYSVNGDMINRVQVAGKKPAYQGAAAAQRPHPLAPEVLALGGVPRYYNEEDTSNAGSDRDSTSKASRLLTQHLRTLKDALSVTIAPMPNLDPLDVLHLGHDTWTGDSFSIPIAGGDMTLGYNALIRRPNVHRVPATAVPKTKTKKSTSSKNAKGGKKK